MLRGIDISDFQGQPDFGTLKNNVDFVLIKASEGNALKENQLDRSQQECYRVGLLTGFYHFARPDLDNSPQDEAQWFINCIWPIHDGDLLALDFEVSYRDHVNWCKAFLDYIYNKIGTRPLIYLNQSLIQGSDWSSVYNANYGIWVASYDNNPNDVSFDTKWPFVTMKQYTDAGQFNGVNGNVDTNSFYGDANAYKAYGYKTPNPPPPPPPNPPPQVLPPELQHYSLNWRDLAVKDQLDVNAPMFLEYRNIDSLVAQKVTEQSNSDKDTIDRLDVEVGSLTNDNKKLGDENMALQDRVTQLTKELADCELTSQSKIDELQKLIDQAGTNLIPKGNLSRGIYNIAITLFTKYGI